MLVENVRAPALQRFRDASASTSSVQGQPLLPVHALLLQKMVEWPPRVRSGTGPILAAHRPNRSEPEHRHERDRRQGSAFSGNNTCNWRAEELIKSEEFRKRICLASERGDGRGNAVGRSPDGLIKHLIHRNMNTPGAVRRGVYAVPQGRRALGQAPTHVEELAFVVEGRLRPALGHAVRLPGQVHLGVGRRAQEVRVERATTSTCRPTPTIRASRPAMPASSIEQSHHQGHGLRLDRPVGAGAGFLKIAHDLRDGALTQRRSISGALIGINGVRRITSGNDRTACRFHEARLAEIAKGSMTMRVSRWLVASATLAIPAAPARPPVARRLLQGQDHRHA